MLTTFFPTVHASVASHQVSALAVSPQVNMFEQVSGLGHQMSLAWDGVRGSLYWGSGSACIGAGPGAGVQQCRGVPWYSEIQGIMNKGYMGTPLWTDRRDG